MGGDVWQRAAEHGADANGDRYGAHGHRRRHANAWYGRYGHDADGHGTDGDAAANCRDDVWPNGPHGPDGADGADGPHGLDGSHGSHGPDGSHGLDGSSHASRDDGTCAWPVLWRSWNNV